MLYPKKIEMRKKEILIKVLLGVSVLIAIIVTTINHLTTPNIPWAALTNAGIIYIWITAIYSINRNINTAGHVVLQTIAVSVLAIFVDNRLGNKGWSIDLAIPIILIISNITMFILTIISHRRYVRYAMYQLTMFFISLLPLYFILQNVAHLKVLSIIACSISMINFIVTMMLCFKEVKEAIVRKFHW